MIREEQKAKKDKIEEIIDSVGPFTFLEMCAEIFVEKADHIAENWQDMNLSKAWRNIGNSLFRLAVKAATL